MEVLKGDDPYTGETHRGVKAACKEVGSDRVIVRTSEPTDFQGMVDAMPTEVVKMGWFSRGRIAKVIEEVRQRCAHPDVLRYAEVEGFGYDPKRVSVSVTPFSGYPHGLVTEHPNQEGVKLVDTWGPYDPVETDHNSADFVGNEQVWSYRYKRDFVRFLPIQKWIRETGVLDLDMAYQFECGNGGRNPVLFQIREFARKAKASFEIGHDYDSSQRRIFGITPEEGVEVVVARGENLRSLFDNVLSGIPANQLLILAPDNIRSLLETDEIPDPRILGYVTKDQAALSHQSTRFMQAALRHQHGFAHLKDLEYYEKYRCGLPRVRVISDGIRQRVEPV